MRGVACECARDGPQDTHATWAALQNTLSVLSYKAKSIMLSIRGDSALSALGPGVNGACLISPTSF